MSKKTPIEWCDSTVNPTMGCDGCELWNDKMKICYAGQMHLMRSKNTGFASQFEHVELFPGRMEEASLYEDLTGIPRWDKPWMHDLPRTIFVSDMSDSLSESVPFEYLRDEIINIVTNEDGCRHHWQWLTKRPARMAKFSEWLLDQGIQWPDNLWAGTSVTTQGTTSRIRDLLKVGDSKTLRFVSVEPQWESIDLGEYLPRLDWVIQGGESGTVQRPFDIAWAYELRAACKQAHVPYFLKQLGQKVISEGKHMKLTSKKGGDMSEWPEDLNRRKESRQMPIYLRDKLGDGTRQRYGGLGLWREGFTEEAIATA